ncbi:hypothetical protein RQP46_001449 [Phenoliferia psychrophenolica]
MKRKLSLDVDADAGPIAEASRRTRPRLASTEDGIEEGYGHASGQYLTFLGRVGVNINRFARWFGLGAASPLPGFRVEDQLAVIELEKKHTDETENREDEAGGGGGMPAADPRMSEDPEMVERRLRVTLKFELGKQLKVVQYETRIPHRLYPEAWR